MAEAFFHIKRICGVTLILCAARCRKRNGGFDVSEVIAEETCGGPGNQESSKAIQFRPLPDAANTI